MQGLIKGIAVRLPNLGVQYWHLRGQPLLSVSHLQISVLGQGTLPINVLQVQISVSHLQISVLKQGTLPINVLSPKKRYLVVLEKIHIQLTATDTTYVGPAPLIPLA